MAYSPIITRNLVGAWRAEDWNAGTNTIANLVGGGPAATSQSGGSYTAAPTYSATGILSAIPSVRCQDVSSGAKTALVFPQALTGSGGWTILVAMVDGTVSGGANYILSDKTSVNTFSLYRSSTYGISVGSTSTKTAWASGLGDPVNQYYLWAFTFNPVTNTVRVLRDFKNPLTYVKGSALDLTGIQLGSPVTEPGDVITRRIDTYMNVMLMYSRMLTDSEILQESTNIQSAYQGTIRKCVDHGNSHLYGSGASNPSVTSARALTKTALLALHSDMIFIDSDCIPGRPSRTQLINFGNAVASQTLIRSIAAFTEDTNEYAFCSFSSMTEAQRQAAINFRSCQMLTEYYVAGYAGALNFTTFVRFTGDSTGYRPAVASARAAWAAKLQAFDKRRTFYYLQEASGEDSRFATLNSTYFYENPVTHVVDIHLNDTGNDVFYTDYMLPGSKSSMYQATPGALSAPTGTTGTAINGLAWTAAGASSIGGTLTSKLQYCLADTGDWADVSGGGSSPADATGLSSGMDYMFRALYTDSNDTTNPFPSNVIYASTTGSPSDTNAPTKTSASVDATGFFVDFVHSKPVRGDTGYTILVNGNAATIRLAGRPNQTTVRYMLLATILATDTVTATYSATSNTGDIRDCNTSSNALANISTPFSVTNNSTAAVDSMLLYAAVAIPGGNINVNGGSSTQFFADPLSATNLASNQGVFTASPNVGTHQLSSGPGSFYENYVAPAAGSSPQVITLTAQSQVDTSKSTSITVTVGQETVKPTFLSASIDLTGTTLTVNLTETTSPPVLPSSGAATFTLSTGQTLGTFTRTTNTQYQASITPAIQSGAMPTLAYTAGNVTDSAATPNTMNSFSGSAITNNSTAVAPAVTTNPLSQTKSNGQTVTFTAAFSGSPGPAPQWQINTGSGWSNLVGETALSYIRVCSTGDNGYQFRCVGTNAAGTATTTAATLTMSDTPAIAPTMGGVTGTPTGLSFSASTGEVGVTSFDFDFNGSITTAVSSPQSFTFPDYSLPAKCRARSRNAAGVGPWSPYKTLGHG